MPFLDPVIDHYDECTLNGINEVGFHSSVDATALESIERLVEDLQDKIRTIKKRSMTNRLDEESRKSALVRTRDLYRALQTPQEGITNYCSIVVVERTSIKIGVDLGIFRIISSSERPVTVKQLAAQTKSEKHLLVRIMRVFVGMGFVKEVGISTYVSTPYCDALAQPGFEGMVNATHDFNAVWRLADFLKENGYKSTHDVNKSPFQYGKNTDLTYFGYIHQKPEGIKAFNDFMGLIRGGRKFWADWYDVQGQLLNGFDEQHGETFLVDVGGGNGHDITALLERFPETRGRLVLQDLPTTLAPVLHSIPQGITPVSHDFFTPQPVIGARVYYTHFILHDWPDNDCRKIITNIKSAMKPGYSRLILNENVLPDRDCAPWAATMDINMMTIMSGSERTSSEWFTLIESTGLEIVSISRSSSVEDVEGIIECVLKE